MTKVFLTRTVKKGGCAAKLPAGLLSSMLKDLNFEKQKGLVVGTESMDDACLWDLGDGRYLIKTLDFFTPIVDDPYDFGAIAAANALSDVYAMGGTPKIALTILAFPSTTLDFKTLKPLMQGALDKIHEAGASLAGGHSIDDDTLKLGFSVTGFVDSEKAWTNTGAQIGDRLFLTKPLGTGAIVSALKLDRGSKEGEEAAIKSMKRLNDLSSISNHLTVNAATDITGFGLCGHALNIAKGSDVTIRIDMDKVPDLPTVRKLLADGIRNKAHASNRSHVLEQGVKFECSKEEPNYWLALDPQTSGGLLLSIPASESEKSLELLRELFPETAEVGEVISAGNAPVIIV